MTSEPRVKCSEQVGEPPGYWHWHRCDRWATQTRDGKPLCTQHAAMYDRHHVSPNG